MSATTTKVTDASFQADVLQSGTPVLVDFWAEWCGPCKQIAPALDELAKEMGDDAKVGAETAEAVSVIIGGLRSLVFPDGTTDDVEEK